MRFLILACIVIICVIVGAGTISAEHPTLAAVLALMAIVALVLDASATNSERRKR